MLAKLEHYFRNLLSESGDISMVRFLSLVCVIVAALLAFYGMYESKHSLESVAVLCGTFLGAGLGAKVMQRKYESVSTPNVPVQDASELENNPLNSVHSSTGTKES